MIPYPRNDEFIGSSQSYVWLKKKLEGTNTGTSSYGRLALWGLGGIGYVSHYKDDVIEAKQIQ